MFFTAALWMLILGKIGGIFLAAAILSSATAIIAGIFWAVNAYESEDDNQKEGDTNFDWKVKSKKICTSWLVVAIISIFITTFTPSTKELILLATFKGVDQYNTTHPNSLISVNGIVGTADDVMKVFQDSLTKVEQMINPPPAPAK
jgi:hypothetical protein